MYRRVVALAVLAVVVVCSGAGIALHSEYRSEKDGGDLADLTFTSPWPREQLLVPDDLPARPMQGRLDRTGLELDFDLSVADGRKVPVAWRLDDPEADDGVDCAAVATITCTDLGDGFTFAVAKQASAGIPYTALVRNEGDRLLTVIVEEPVYVAADALRPVLTNTHRPTDAELLKLLRPDGYQTDWS